MKPRSLLLLLVVAANASHAQAPFIHHRCWDIDIPARSRLPLRAVEPTVEVDSGSLLVEYAKQYLGTPYRYGGKTPAGFDCAGFARYLYQHFGHTLPPYSGGQYQVGLRIDDPRRLMPGDLVFFGGRHHPHAVGHTGIVVESLAGGQFRFIHAATTGGVIISRSTEPYYSERYIGACRIFPPAGSTR